MTSAPRPTQSGAGIDAGPTARSASLTRHAVSHGTVFIVLLLSLYWLQASETGAGGLTRYAGATWGFLTGMALSHLIHEWGHYLGARASGATTTLKQGVHPLFFDYVFAANSPRQFLVMSMGGLLGNLLLLAAMIALARPDALVLKSALAAVVGQLIFVIVLELPVSLAAVAGEAPYAALERHFSQGGALFLRAAALGVAGAATILAWY
jgi:hypothetical protein